MLELQVDDNSGHYVVEHDYTPSTTPQSISLTYHSKLTSPTATLKSYIYSEQSRLD